MIRWNRTRLCALVAATATVAAVTVSLGGGTASADGSLVQTAEWMPFPQDTQGHGFVAVDDAAEVGYAFSGTVDNGMWTRVQAISTRTGKPLGGVAATRPIPTRTPVLVDPKRHAVIVAETYGSNTTPGTPSFLVGLGLRGKDVKEVFRVPSPFAATHRIAGFALDDTGRDLVVVGTLDGAGQNAIQGSSVVAVQRVAYDALFANTLTSRWSSAYEVPKGSCPTLIQTAQPAGVLAVRDQTWIACRGTSNFVQGTNGQHLTGASGAIIRVTGLGATRAEAPVTRLFRTPGNFTIAGESVADPRTRRFVVVESSGYIGLRVFDTDHSRYVGRINAGQQILYGLTIDHRSSRAYFASMDDKVGIGFGDLAAVVPTQGERLPDPYAAYVNKGVARRLWFDPARRRLYVPMRRVNSAGLNEEYLVVLTDASEPYKAPAPLDHAAGSIDAVDREGVTESSIATTARAFGADYQVIGGTANLLQNVAGTDTRGIARPGTRHLRQAYVKSSSLTGDGAVAAATTAEEDATTDQDRNAVTAPSPAPSSATAGSRFAPLAECADYGAGKTDAVAPRTTVSCDLRGETVLSASEFLADDAVLVTAPATGQPAPVLAPVQTGKSRTEVRQQRLPNRGALVTTITTTTDNVTIGDVVSFGRVTQVVTVTAHGRSGTAKVERRASIANVVVQGRDVCGAQCHPATVQQQVNAALDGRGGIEFPPVAAFADKRGTYAEFTQDPWYHAERVLDYDKANDDYVVPVMSIQYWMDSTSKSRLVVDVAGVAATVSYRVYPLGTDDNDGGDDDGDDDGGTVTGPGTEQPRPIVTIAPTTAPGGGASPKPSAPQVAQGGDEGFVNTLVDRLSLSMRSLREAIPLLLIWALLAVPTYLAARRRLLLELPMLTRDEELTS